MTPPGVRVLLDANTIVSAVIMRDRPGNLSAKVLDMLLARTGQDELVVCPQLLSEVDDVPRRPKIRRYVSVDEVSEILAMIVAASMIVPDPAPPIPHHTSDQDDDYLVAVALRDGFLIVTGDADILRPRNEPPPYPVMTPREYWDSRHPGGRRVTMTPTPGVPKA